MENKLLTLEEACDKIGVTPLELYMRQNHQCYLVGGTVVSGVLGPLYCTDGVDTAPTEFLANPTIECSQCLVRYVYSRALSADTRLTDYLRWVRERS